LQSDIDENFFRILTAKDGKSASFLTARGGKSARFLTARDGKSARILTARGGKSARILSARGREDRRTKIVMISQVDRQRVGLFLKFCKANHIQHFCTDMPCLTTPF
jgi:Tol biopolymer transport system component